MPFRVLAHADVADGGGHQDALGAFERAQHDLDGEIAAILPPCNEFNPRTDLLRQGVRRGSRAVGDEAFRETLWNDVLYRLADEFIAVVSELLLRLEVQQDDFTGGVYNHHGIGSCFEQPAVLRLRFLAFADVPADLGEAEQAPRRIACRGDDDIGPKPGPVFSHAPVFYFRPAACNREL